MVNWWFGPGGLDFGDPLMTGIPILSGTKMEAQSTEAQTTNLLLALAKLLYFTNLDFPEIRGFPFLSYFLRWGRLTSLLDHII